ncbi:MULTISPECIES: carbamoyl-phosphate synthase large subunit [Mogibacterium]|uniref:Carbamoyl phosphate synthase large chain n=1 Tax=Mogibacterium timidum ATCC 33093 TaxID=1401079 RepID=X8IRF7_9FIRM|nr:MULTISPECIES: carbamoyl-phosphate synthase large subunit [Mogibacterium]EUC51591.1 carbamoyl-phosphate synthase, large subunit [Mogibacterium timidum ATCC 33093]
MARRSDIRKILVIGSGPIVIGQAAEFDYAGTQACIALREEGYEVVLCNSNPATIMTDTSMADKVYMEPLTLEYLARIIRYERPDAILPGIGGQTGLNLAMQLDKKGVLRECRAELLGTKSDSIERAEDRELFKELCEELGEPVLQSEVANDEDEGLEIARGIGFPVVLRPAFTLGGTGGGFADDETEFREMIRRALAISPTHQVLIEKSIKGYKEIEYEVMRDGNDTAIAICDMENIDPVGIHTGDSIVVCPTQTVSESDCAMLKSSALKIIRALRIEGGCNVQFALNPNSSEYYLIEVNPRVSRSSALASKASGYPIARITAKIAVGMTLDEIEIIDQPASVEPVVDYIVSKVPRFPFDKFADADNKLGTQMKATGEVMSIGRSLEESMLKAVRSLEIGVAHVYMEKFDSWDTDDMKSYIAEGRDDRIFAIAELLRRGISRSEICKLTAINEYFIEMLENIVDIENELREHRNDVARLRIAKQYGFSDAEIARLWNMPEAQVWRLREAVELFPTYDMIDSCAASKDAYVPYFYSTFNDSGNTHIADSGRRKVVVLGSGPIRIGQGVEFDYSTVQAVKSLRSQGCEAIIINNNPETVSTDYTTADKLYFEPLCIEDVMNILRLEQPEGVIVSLGGQTAVNLASALDERGVNIIGTDCTAINAAEDRDEFDKLMQRLDIDKPEGKAVTDIDEGCRVAREIGYPVLVRPSFVLGGRAMRIVADEEQLRQYLRTAVEIDEDKPVLVDHYIRGKEVEVDAICDGKDVFIPGIMELVERTGVHSGDSISVYPPCSISDSVKEIIRAYTEKLGLGIGIRGLFNIQFIVDPSEQVYIIEVNPRSSRTVPFLSKATGYNLADIASKVMLGISLEEQGLKGVPPMEKKRWYVKVPAFSFAKLSGMDIRLSPEMKSTGEAIGYDDDLMRAFYKAMQAAGMRMQNYGTVFASINDESKADALPLIRRFYDLGFNIEATEGTAQFLKANGVKTRSFPHTDNSMDAVANELRQGYVTYLINIGDIRSVDANSMGSRIRRCAAENNVTTLTSLDTVKVLLDALGDITFKVSTIDA